MQRFILKTPTQGLSRKGHLRLQASETHVGDSRDLQTTENRHSPWEEPALLHQQKSRPARKGFKGLSSSPRSQPAGPPAHPCRLGPRHSCRPRPRDKPARGRAGSWPSRVYPGSVASPGFVCHSKEYGTRQQNQAKQLGLLKVSAEDSGQVGRTSRLQPPGAHLSVAALPGSCHPHRAIPDGHPAPRAARSGVPTVPSRLTPPPTSSRLLLSALGKAD